MTEEPPRFHSGQALDAATVAGAQRGDPLARERLLEEAYRRIFRYHLRLTGGARDEAQDLTQDTMVKLMRSLHELREPGVFVPWALRIAANIWRDRRRRLPLRKTVGLAEDDLPVETSESDERSARVLGLLRSLESPYREAVSLRYLEGLDYEAMSQVMETATGTVKSWVARGLQRIRKKMEGAP